MTGRALRRELRFTERYTAVLSALDAAIDSNDQPRIAALLDEERVARDALTVAAHAPRSAPDVSERDLVDSLAAARTRAAAALDRVRARVAHRHRDLAQRLDGIALPPRARSVYTSDRQGSMLDTSG